MFNLTFLLGFPSIILFSLNKYLLGINFPQLLREHSEPKRPLDAIREASTQVRKKEGQRSLLRKSFVQKDKQERGEDLQRAGKKRQGVFGEASGSRMASEHWSSNFTSASNHLEGLLNANCWTWPSESPIL